MKENPDYVMLRFNKKEQQQLRKMIDPEQKTSTQIKTIIFSRFEEMTSRPEKVPDALRVESLLRERLDQVTSLLVMFAQRLDELDGRLDTIGKDAARSRLVVENIQNYLSESGQEEGS